MTPFTIVSLFVSIFCFILSIVIFKCSYLSLHRAWSLFNLAVGSWSLGLVFVGISNSPNEAVLAWRFTYATGIFIITGFYHFVYLLCGLKKENVLKTVYCVGLFFIPIIIFSDHLIDPHKINLMFDRLYYQCCPVKF